MEPQGERLRILVIEDDADTRLNLCDILELDGHLVDTAATATEALARSDWEEISAILLDRKLPDGSAQELLPRLRELAPQASIMVVTGFADLDGAILALRHGAEDYLLKPINPDLLRASLMRIAERGRARQEIIRLNNDLQRRVNEMQALFNVIPVGIGIAEDAECRHIRANPPLARVLGIDVQANASLSAKPDERPNIRVLKDEHELKAEELPMQLAARHCVEVHDMDIDLVRADSTVVNLLSYAAPLLDKDGKSVGSVGAFLDVTERKLSHARELQRERLAAIGETMAGLVHESRNALQRSKACLEMLALEVEDRPEALNLVTRVQHAQDYLQQLYEEVREYAAPINLRREPCDLAHLWRDIWDDLAHIREAKQLARREELNVANLISNIDRFAIGQVFRNILENAVSVSPLKAEICIRCCETRFHNRPAISVAFCDQGPGLTAGQRKRIFEPFFTTKTKGTGLGMAIAQRIVESHGGLISLGPPDHAGAEIIVILPQA